MTRPTTSSIIAAVVKTVPRRVADKPLVLRTVKVVPRLVEHSAAPAAKACTGVAPTSVRRTKERAMGKAIPVIATATERNKLAFREEKLVSRPPCLHISTHTLEGCRRITFVDKQDESQITELNHRIFDVETEPLILESAMQNMEDVDDSMSRSSRDPENGKSTPGIDLLLLLVDPMQYQ
jgi:hypothetical protein